MTETTRTDVAPDTDAADEPAATGARHIVLHVGTMKTGTSTLQKTFARNLAAVTRAGHRYLGWGARTSQRIEERLAKIDPALDVIVSDEGLWHFSGTPRSDTARIAEVLADFDVTIVVYFRRPDEYVESWFSQGLKTGLGSDDLVSFLQSGFVNSRPFVPTDSRPVSFDTPGFVESIDLRIEQRLEFFAATFPGARIVVRPFERAQLVGGDIVPDFLHVVGLSDVPIERVPNENVSPSADTVLLAALLRRRYDVPDDVIAAFLRTHTPPQVSHHVRTRIMRYEEAVAINDAMRPVFRAVQARWGGGATDDFFLNWDLDPETFHTSELRDLYDARVGER